MVRICCAVVKVEIVKIEIVEKFKFSMDFRAARLGKSIYTQCIVWGCRAEIVYITQCVVWGCRVGDVYITQCVVWGCRADIVYITQCVI